jgi:hypothetical protein
MLKETVTYVDFNGIERKEDVYFNLTQSELMEMELGTEGGFAEKLQKLVDAQDGPGLFKNFKDIIKKAYGVKSDDGKRFIKSPELSEEFTQTPVYDQIFMKLVTDDKEAARFINGIVPKELSEQAAANGTHPALMK